MGFLDVFGGAIVGGCGQAVGSTIKLALRNFSQPNRHTEISVMVEVDATRSGHDRILTILRLDGPDIRYIKMLACCN